MKKPVVRVISIILVTLLALGMFSGVFVMFAHAAVSQEILTADTTVSPTPLTVGKFRENVRIVFRFKATSDFESAGYKDTTGLDIDLDDFSLPASSSFGLSTKSKLKITYKNDYYEAVLSGILYNGGSSKALELDIGITSDPLDPYEFHFYVPLSNKFFKEPSESETDEGPESDIVVQSVVVKNAAGEKLPEVNKKTAPFSVEITFYDVGLKNESSKSIDAAKKYVYITSHAGFKLHSGTTGKLERLSSSEVYPRFKATFENIQTDESANALGFRVQYEFDEYEKGVKGEPALPVTIHQVKTKAEEDEEEEIPLLIPKVIVQEYSYGEDAIVAGNEFNLDITFVNTSKTVAVENVDMKIEPGTGFRIAAAANTAYFPNIGIGESKPYAIALRALPSQNTTGNEKDPTDYSVTITFSYQYLKDKKTYDKYENPVKIAIPVEQLDRFSAGEITDYTQYVMAGSEAYVSVPVTNKGKSATMNITGSVRSVSGGEFVSADVPFGNLEAGKSATIDITLTINTPGEFRGEAVISYEDENENQKQLEVPFSIMVEPPPQVMPETPVNPDTAPDKAAPHPLSIAFCTLGGLMVAAPVALGLMKRIKSRGSEDIDEDF